MPRDEMRGASATRRSLLMSVCLAALAPRCPSGGDGPTDLYRQWLATDAELELLYTGWAALDVSLMTVRRRGFGPGHEDQRITDKMAELDGKIDAAIIRRDDILKRLQETSVRSVQDAIAKLRVAVHRLEGEGGPEHRLVRDALFYLSH